jgi:Fur family ferric uptake transcriptional regulator
VPTEPRDAALARLRAAGQRVTKGRESLIAVLAATDHPLTLPEILAIGPDLAQSTAYRNLTALEQAEVVRRVNGADEFARYELAEDLTEHHHHLICGRCGRVVDVGAPAGLEAAVEHAVREIEREHGFAVRHHRVDLVGVCADCR